MRLTSLGKRLALASVLAGAAAPGLGCRRGPYIDPTKVVPHETMGMTSQEDADVKQASFLQENLAMPLPKTSDPRTTSNPEAELIWELPLQEAIKIYLDNSEVVRVIALGAQGIPVG